MPSCSATNGLSQTTNPAIRKIDVERAYIGPFSLNITIIVLFLGGMFVRHINSFKINM